MRLEVGWAQTPITSGKIHGKLKWRQLRDAKQLAAINEGLFN
jgi:hypothetical protein